MHCVIPEAGRAMGPQTRGPILMSCLARDGAVAEPARAVLRTGLLRSPSLGGVDDRRKRERRDCRSAQGIELVVGGEWLCRSLALLTLVSILAVDRIVLHRHRRVSWARETGASGDAMVVVEGEIVARAPACANVAVDVTE